MFVKFNKYVHLFNYLQLSIFKYFSVYFHYKVFNDDFLKIFINMIFSIVKYSIYLQQKNKLTKYTFSIHLNLTDFLIFIVKTNVYATKVIKQNFCYFNINKDTIILQKNHKCNFPKKIKLLSNILISSVY